MKWQWPCGHGEALETRKGEGRVYTLRGKAIPDLGHGTGFVRDGAFIEASLQGPCRRKRKGRKKFEEGRRSKKSNPILKELTFLRSHGSQRETGRKKNKKSEQTFRGEIDRL